MKPGDVGKPSVHPRTELDRSNVMAHALRFSIQLLLARRRRPLAEQQRLLDRKYLLQEEDPEHAKN